MSTDKTTTEPSKAELLALRAGAAFWIAAQVFLLPLAPRTRLARIKWWMWFYSGYAAEREGADAFNQWKARQPPGAPPRVVAWHEQQNGKSA